MSMFQQCYNLLEIWFDLVIKTFMSDDQTAENNCSEITLWNVVALLVFAGDEVQNLTMIYSLLSINYINLIDSYK